MNKWEDLRTGWLSPTGEFTPAAYYDHSSVAAEIAESLNMPDYDTGRERRIHADEKLVRAGFVLIGRSMLFSEWRIEWDLYHVLTPEQRRFLAPYFEVKDYIDEVTLMRWETER